MAIETPESIKALLASGKTLMEFSDAELAEFSAFRRAQVAEKEREEENAKYAPTETAISEAILAVLNSEGAVKMPSFNLHYTPAIPAVEAVAAVAEVKDADGNVTTPAVAAVEAVEGKAAEFTISRGTVSTPRTPRTPSTGDGGTRKSQADPFTIGGLSKKAMVAYPQLKVGETFESALALQNKLGLASAMVKKSGETEAKPQPGRYTLRTAGIDEKKN